MALDLRLQVKLSQQLVMTPQLQQAIKLLQLGRMELVDVVTKELEENPMLEEGAELAEGREEQKLTGDESESPTTTDDSHQEVKGEAEGMNDIDWQTYLDGYSLSSGTSDVYEDSEERPSYESLLTKKKYPAGPPGVAARALICFRRGEDGDQRNYRQSRRRRLPALQPRRTR